MSTIKNKLLTDNYVAVIPLKAGHIRRYITLLAGAGLTTASFMVSGGSLALLGSGIMCGVGLKLSLKSIQQISNQSVSCKSNQNEDEHNKTDDEEEESSLLQDTSIGALNGLISSLGMVCMAQSECSHQFYGDDGTQQMMASYALTGLITGTINGTINEVISYTQSQTDCVNDNDGDIDLLNVTKCSVMEMGSNLFTAFGKATIFKSAADSEEWNSKRKQSEKSVLKRRSERAQFTVYREPLQRIYGQRLRSKMLPFQRDKLLKSVWMDIA